jgi:DNA-binding CsgD family transcriptional regulator
VEARQDVRTRDLFTAAPRRVATIRHAAVVRSEQTSGAGARSATIGRGEPSRIDPDLVEQTLTACLTLLAQTAAETGQSERALRLRGAVCVLRGQAHASDWSSAATRPVASPTAERRSRPPTSAIPLTDRQREVAALIRQGMTNREIADALVIAERTADTHVENILNKLGLVSRAQIAAWAVEQGVDLSQPRAWS